MQTLLRSRVYITQQPQGQAIRREALLNFIARHKHAQTHKLHSKVLRLDLARQCVCNAASSKLDELQGDQGQLSVKLATVQYATHKSGHT